MNSKNINKSINSYKEQSYEKFKEYERYKFLIAHILPVLGHDKSLLDIGCAKGELIYILRETYPDISYHGLEYSQELINMARAQDFFKDVDFTQGDAQDFELNKSFDVTVMSGVLSIFDDIEKPLNMMIKHTNPGGYGFIFGGFTREDIDVMVRFRNNYAGSQTWESGWNMFSIHTVKSYLKPFVNQIDIIPFEIPIDLKKSPDPVRGYTILAEEGKRLILTGGNIVRDFHLIFFKKR